MIRYLLLVTGVIGVPLQGQVYDWGYQKYNGPETWGQHYPECCKLGQSPIALPTFWADHHFLKRLEYHNFDLDCDLMLYNDGKSVTLVVKDDPKRARPSVTGSVLNPKSRYLLDRVVIRAGNSDLTGSEHGMDGKFYDGEMQWFFFDEKFKSFEDAVKTPGAIAIVSQLLQVTKKDNAFFDCIVDNVDKINKSKKPVDLKWLLLPELLPRYTEDKKGNKECANCDYYFYEGSLTYPPCSEVALWHVYMEPISISEHQLDKIKNVYSWQSGECVKGNVRNVQPINFREVLQHRERSMEAYKDHHNLPPKMPPQPPMPPMPQFPGGPLPPFPVPGKDNQEMLEYWPQDQQQQYPPMHPHPQQYPPQPNPYPRS